MYNRSYPLLRYGHRNTHKGKHLQRIWYVVMETDRKLVFIDSVYVCMCVHGGWEIGGNKLPRQTGSSLHASPCEAINTKGALHKIPLFNSEIIFVVQIEELELAEVGVEEYVPISLFHRWECVTKLHKYVHILKGISEN